MWRSISSYWKQHGIFHVMLVCREGHWTQDMKNFKISALRRCIGYVGQEFSGPVSISYPCLIRSHGGVFEGFLCGNFRGNYRHRLFGFAGIFELLWSIIWPQCRKIHFKQDTNENLRAVGFQWLESLGSLTPHGLLEFVLENPPKFHSFTVPIRAAMKNQQFRS